MSKGSGSCNICLSFNCCFAKDTKITVKQNGKIYKKNIQDIKDDDIVLYQSKI